jgi:hypothetical protein
MFDAHTSVMAVKEQFPAVMAFHLVFILGYLDTLWVVFATATANQCVTGGSKPKASF